MVLPPDTRRERTARKTGRYHADQGAEPLRLYGRGNTCRRESRCGAHPCRCLEGYGFLGEGKCGALRSFESAHPLSGGRLCEIRGTGNPKGKSLRRYHHGSSLLRKGAERGNLENRRQYLPLPASCREDSEEGRALLSLEFLHNRPASRCDAIYAGRNHRKEKNGAGPLR